MTLKLVCGICDTVGRTYVRIKYGITLMTLAGVGLAKARPNKNPAYFANIKALTLVPALRAGLSQQISL